MAMLLGQLPILEKLDSEKSEILLKLILNDLDLGKETKALTKEMNLINAFKKENKHVILLILTNLIERKHISIYTHLQKYEESTQGIERYETSLRNPKTTNYEISKHQIKEIMGACLKAVSHFFENKKSFKTLAIYLKLAFKIFMCVGVEGSQTILAGRSLYEFNIYFLMKLLKPGLDNEGPSNIDQTNI